ncbi:MULTISPECIES: DUF4870 domain-containing protein [unclassified Salinibacterium]|uniref:DUF4870 domain-containing protein n=1 Tax=unclassified Salinibacterium TaxID=2632331 RepID=UPI001CD59DDF|nr:MULTISPECIES: DUF4870 domain-containing protein [unclassified Salinibacterium]
MSNEQNPYANSPQPMSPSDERLWSTLLHVGGAVANFFTLAGFGWIIGIIGYVILKDRGPLVRAHSATELNFQLTLLIAAVVGWITTLVLVGFLILAATWVVAIVFGIIAAVKANNGEYYTYPVAIRFIR